MTNQYSIKGMTCTACQKIVTKRLSKIEGVSSVDVNLKNETADIVSERLITFEQVSAALTGSHYSVIIHSSLL